MPRYPVYSLFDMASFQIGALRTAADCLIFEDRQFYKLRASTLKTILSDELIFPLEDNVESGSKWNG